jgi:hypothetical protein
MSARRFSKISTPLKPGAPIASSFSSSVPLKQTVAIAGRMDVLVLNTVKKADHARHLGVIVRLVAAAVAFLFKQSARRIR